MERNALQCDLECCTNTSSPYQPFSAAIAQATKQEYGKQFRYFQKHWYAEFPWLSFCTTRNRVFCFYCRSCFHNKELSFSKCLDSTFTIDGYKNWKKARCKFESHENSDCHIEAIYKFKTRSSAGVDVQLNDQIKKTHVVRQKAFLQVCVFFCGKGLQLEDIMK